MTEVSN